MKRILAFLSMSLLAAASARAATLSPSLPAESYCGARTSLVTALDGSREARTYAVAFQAGGGDPGLLSGTLTMYVGDSRYDFPFRDVKIYPALDLATLTPLVVRFPTPVKLDAVYLSAIDGPDGGPCVLASRTSVLPELDDAYTAKARSLKPLDAPPPVHDPAPCDKPYVAAHAIRLAPLGDVDRSLTGGAGKVVRVRVHLDADGKILDVTPIPPAAPEPFEQAALLAARASTFAPEIERCKPVEGGYTYIAVFDNHF